MAGKKKNAVEVIEPEYTSPFTTEIGQPIAVSETVSRTTRKTKNTAKQSSEDATEAAKEYLAPHMAQIYSTIVGLALDSSGSTSAATRLRACEMAHAIMTTDTTEQATETQTVHFAALQQLAKL